jgi:hypothetical protein
MNVKMTHTDPPCEACRIEGTGPYATPKDTVWKAVKAALKEYGREYPKTWAGRLINTIWGGP